MREPAYASVPLDDLTPHPRNVREGDVGAIVESLREFGQYRPIVVQHHEAVEGPAVIIAGTHTWMAHRALRDEDPERWGTIAAVIVDVDDATATRIMLADNRTHDLGRDRPDDLATLLAELGAPEWPGTGWDGDALDEMLRDLGRYDPGAGILGAFDGVTGAGAGESSFTDASRAGERTGFTLALSLTAAQRGVVLEAFKAAKAQGYETQPEAIEAIARHYLEGPR